MKNLKIVNELIKMVDKNLPNILTVTSILGTGATGILSYKAGEDIAKLEEDEKTPKNIAKAVAPPVITGASTIACIVGLNHAHARKYAALMSMYALSQTDLNTYKEEVEKIFGKEGKEKVDKESKKRQSPVIVDGYRYQNFLDKVTGRYFASTVFKIQQAQNQVNELIVKEGRANLNDFYKFLGLDEVELGELIQWHRGDVYDVIDVTFDTEMTQDMMPIMTISYDVESYYSW